MVDGLTTPPDPRYREALNRVRSFLNRVGDTNVREPLVVALATADAVGRPSLRMVLLRGFDERGFVFFTNALSRKGRELATNPRAALCFYSHELHEQVRVEGSVVTVPDGESDAYWFGRPRESQLSSAASLQSEPLESRESLEARVAELDHRLAGRAVPRPDHWLGYRVEPDRIEFWSSRPARLHDRDAYDKLADGWRHQLLYP